MTILQFNLLITLGFESNKMSNFICHINLDYDPENEELAVILNNADNFCNALELADIDFDSIKICIDSPIFTYIRLISFYFTF